MILFGERSLRKTVNEYVEHYPHEQNDQGLNNLISFPNSPQSHSEYGLIVKSEPLGGLLNYYHHEEK